MKKETEITVQVFGSLEQVKSELLEKGFSITQEYIMTDFYFSKYSLEELKKFEYVELIKNSFLVRSVDLENTTEVVILYKDKVVDNDNNVISEQKHLCHIEDIESILKIFDLAKLNCWCELKQNILIFDNGKVSFALQEVEGLGLFIEYEEDDNIRMFNEYDKISFMLDRLKELDLKIGEDYSCKKVYIKFKNMYK